MANPSFSSKKLAVGFDGLVAWATNIDDAISAADHIVATRPVSTARTGSAAPMQASHSDGGALIGGVKKLLLPILLDGRVILLGLVFGGAFIADLISDHHNQPNQNYASVPDNSQQIPEVAASQDIVVNAPPAHVERPPAPVVDSDSGEMTKPESGAAPLTIAELRYCLAEGIRLDGQKAELDAQPQPEGDVTNANRNIDDYNSAARDYNSVCNHRQYWHRDKSVAESQIEAKRLMLESEGRRRVN